MLSYKFFYHATLLTLNLCTYPNLLFKVFYDDYWDCNDQIAGHFNYKLFETFCPLPDRCKEDEKQTKQTSQS